MSENGKHIAVVGGGIIGLSVAARLASAGRRVLVYTRDDVSQTTSSRAGAVFSAFDAWDLRDELVESARAFALLARGEPRSGVSLRASREYWSVPREAPAWTTLVADVLGGHVEHLGAVGAYAGGFRLVVPQIDIVQYMPWLREQALEAGASIVVGAVANLNDIFDQGASLVVNASGLGARELAGDSAVTPMRGQVLHVPNALGLTEALDATEPDGRITYIYPFTRHVVLGGTYEPGQERCETDEATLLEILERCRQLLALHGYERAAELGRERLRAVAGLRPARVLSGRMEAVRIEREDTAHGQVIHAYGHGRAGVTLSWGTAWRVQKLVDKAGVE